jgi:hypothetical protein
MPHSPTGAAACHNTCRSLEALTHGRLMDMFMRHTALDFSLTIKTALPLMSLLTTLATTGCLTRDLGLDGPRTTSLISEQIRQGPASKLDLLLVIDNSASMSDKQEVLAEALPDLIRNLVLPPCITPLGVRQARAADSPCAPGSVPEFEPLGDLQVGVITTSLGGFGIHDDDCASEEASDMAHLLPTRPRANHVPSEHGVLGWKAGQPLDAFIANVGEVVTLAGEHGCGRESSLEAWYRFLIDPTPYTGLELGQCSHDPSLNDCTVRKVGPEGLPAIDTELLAQRQQFLRPDSLVAIAMLTDENDCSSEVGPYVWTMASYSPMFKAASACDANPNDRCCQSCGAVLVDGCASETDRSGATVAAGCGASGTYGLNDPKDASNLRCFNQKQRFGIDFLHPTSRYVNALRQKQLCHKVQSNDPRACGAEELEPNPLYSAHPGVVRDNPNDVFLVGILGVPWQNLSASTDSSSPLRYRPAVGTASEAGINWDWLLRDSATQDPLMRESVLPRQGTNPSLQAPLSPPGAPRLANPINGHEHANTSQNELQFACVFPLNSPRDCTADNPDMRYCDCETLGTDEEGNPLCQAPDGSFGTTQYFAKAYPGLRQLDVLHGVGESAVVASICAKETVDSESPDYGYRPAMQAIVDKLKGKLTQVCFGRQLQTEAEGQTNCRVIELLPGAEACTCEGIRSAPNDLVLGSVRQQMLRQKICASQSECDAMCACEVSQVPSGTNGQLNSCQTDAQSTDDGWCYVDANQSPESEQLVANCQESAKRTVRFVGDGVPRDNSVTFLACQGQNYDEGALQ